LAVYEHPSNAWRYFAERALSVSWLPEEGQALGCAQARLIVSFTDWDRVNSGLVRGLIAPALERAAPPQHLVDGQWHLPCVDFEDDMSPHFVPFAGRDRAFDFSIERLAETDRASLWKSGDFYSFTEHQAQASGEKRRYANFVGWKQYRFLVDSRWGEAPPVDTGYTPYYADMEKAFLRVLTQIDSDIAAPYLEEFFPRVKL